MINQLTLTNDDRLRIQRELQAKKCFCGKPKPVGSSFCAADLKILPKPLQSRLRQSVGKDYEQAYMEALRYSR